MDRRQRKSREAIFRAFTELLQENKSDHITVSKIIERADVGRATFYAHFETREALIEALCQDLFCHIFDAMNDAQQDHRHLFQCEAPQSVFEHLFRHLRINDHQILRLLTAQCDGLFVECFRDELGKLLQHQPHILAEGAKRGLPEDYWLSHVIDSFIGTVRWWYAHGFSISPEEVTDYFLKANQMHE